MAQSKTEICNLALARLGKDQFIGNIETEQSKPARLCRQFYPMALAELLEDYDWTFAQSVVQLAVPVGDPPPGWSFQYSLPADCLSPIRVCDESGARLWSWSWLNRGLNSTLQMPDIPFKKMRSASSGGVVIVTDMPDAFLIYTAQVDNSGDYSALFVSALAWRLAVELAMPMAVEPSLAKMASDALGSVLAMAWNKDARDQSFGALPDSPSVAIRG